MWVMTTAQQTGSVPVWTLGDRCRKAREHAGLDQNEMADLIGVSRTTVGNVENGRRAVRQIVLNQWSLATGVPISWLQYGDEAPRPDDPAGVRIVCASRDSNPEPAGSVSLLIRRPERQSWLDRRTA